MHLLTTFTMNTREGRKHWRKPCSRCRNKTHFPKKWAVKPRGPATANTLLASLWLCSANSWVSNCCFMRPHRLAVIQERNLQRLGLNSQGRGAEHFPGISNCLRDWPVVLQCQIRLSTNAVTPTGGSATALEKGPPSEDWASGVKIDSRPTSCAQCDLRISKSGPKGTESCQVFAFQQVHEPAM